MNPSSSLKRSRNELLLEQKREICQYHMDNPNIKLTQLRELFCKQFGIAISKTAFYEILKKSNQILSFTEPISNHPMVRMRKPNYPALEEVLSKWYRTQIREGKVVTNALLIEQARFEGSLLQINDFNYSINWLQKFKARNRIGVNNENTYETYSPKNLIEYSQEDNSKDINEDEEDDKEENVSSKGLESNERFKRPRSRLFLGQNNQISEYYKEYPEMSQEKIRTQFSSVLCRSTFSDILKDNNRILTYQSSENTVNMQEPNLSNLEQVLIDWYHSQLRNGKIISDDNLFEQAQYLAQELKIQFGFTRKWLSSLKTHHNIKTTSEFGIEGSQGISLHDLILNEYSSQTDDEENNEVYSMFENDDSLKRREANETATDNRDDIPTSKSNDFSQDIEDIDSISMQTNDNTEQIELGEIQENSHSTRKRKRGEFLIEQKKEICEYFRTNPNMTQEDDRKYFSGVFCQNTPKTTSREILRDSKRILNYQPSNSCQRRMRKYSKSFKLEDTLNCQGQNVTNSEVTISNKQRNYLSISDREDLNNECSEESVHYSNKSIFVSTSNTNHDHRKVVDALELVRNYLESSDIWDLKALQSYEYLKRKLNELKHINC